MSLYSITTATVKIANLKKRIRAIQGGTSAGKTIGIMQVLIDKCQRDDKGDVTSIVSESLPHLKLGAMRDFLNIMKSHNYYVDSRWNRSDFVYSFESGAIMEFFSADQPIKVRGPRRKRLFCNEANRFPLETFEQLEVRTLDEIYLDWNPSGEFWFYTDILGKRNDVDHIVLTYLDNEALDKKIRDSIEQRKGRKGWWQVYGLGQLGEVEGKIYKDWDIIDEIPHEARLVRRGLDFGYTNDPSALADVYKYNGGYILDETLYQKGLSNKQISDVVANLDEPQQLIIADSAEPKSIDELKMYGLNVIAAEKGAGSVLQGIQLVQDQRISVTKRSANIIREYRNYLWTVDKNGKILNEPEHAFSHCFAPETLIHTTLGKIRIDELVGQVGYLYTRNGKVEKFFDVRPTRKNAEVINIEFDENDILTVTPDHLLLLPNGEWIEAGLLRLSDMIQSGNGKQNCISIKDFFKIQRFKILQRISKWEETIFTSCDMGITQWRNTRELSYSSQGWQSRKQRNREFGIETQNSSFERAYDGRTTSDSKRMDKENITTRKEMAWVRRGEKMAQVTWEENLRSKKTCFKKLHSLPCQLFNKTVCKISKILRTKLQNESTAKKITGITRGFRSITYNLEVENTHCLIANGVVAHNSMDSCRYAITSLLKNPENDPLESFRVEQNRFERTVRVNDFGLS